MAVSVVSCPTVHWLTDDAGHCRLPDGSFDVG
jgi:hypothetical protein